MMRLTVEAGIFGGVPQGGLDFEAAINPEAMIEHQAVFDFHDGGGLDMCFVGLAQTDRDGNSNVSKFGARVMGCGGYINIAQSSKKVVFCGTFTNGAEVRIEDGKLVMVKEVKSKKLIREVDQITCSGRYPQSINQAVL
jgi:propionate CoA-transferase